MKFLVLFCASSLYTTILCAQSIAGPMNPGTFSTAPIVGSNQTWVNPGNVATSDGVFSTFGNLSNPPGTYTNYLVATNFGFNIPNGSTISGIVVQVQREDPNSRTADYSVVIIKGGVLGSTDRSGGAAYPTSDSYQTYGNAGDLWGQTWTVADINDPGFGVAVAAQRIITGGVTAGEIDNIQILVYYNFAILPVNLISFTGAINNKTVLLTWTTAQEINMEGYTVERSADGNNFTSIGNIASRNSSVTTQYTYTDENPIQGISYYRLMMKGISGYEKYSPTLLIQFSSESSVSIYPNPAKQGQSIFINNPNNEFLNLQFYDQAGKLVSNFSTSSGQIPSNALPSLNGMLFYNVYNRQGVLYTRGKLILQ